MTQQHLGQDSGQDSGQDLGHDLRHYVGQDELDHQDPGTGSLGPLFDSSPARFVQTSAAATIGFVLALMGVLAVPFSLALALSAGMAAVALVASVIGLARSSRPAVAGGLLASVGLVLALVTLALVGLRYAGIDTAVGDGLVPSLREVLDSLNGLLPRP